MKHFHLLPAQSGFKRSRRREEAELACQQKSASSRRRLRLFLGVLESAILQRRLGLGLLLCLSASQPSVAAEVTNRIVVMISVDGLAGFYLDDPKAEMPTIRNLAVAGARSSQMKASTPTVTWPNHTTLVTGVNPARHGVLGNNYFDRGTGRRVRLIADPVYEKEQIVKVPTLYDLAKQQGLKTAAIRWPASRDARTLDWTIPDMSIGQPTLSHTTPALIAACARAGIPFGSTNESSEPKPPVDVTYTQIFKMILHDLRPNLALLHLDQVDHIQHSNGPRTPEAYAAIKEADAQIGEIWAVLKRDFPERATLIIVSDHGFSPIRRMLLPNVLLRKAGLLGSTNGGPVQLVGQGGASLVYVTDQQHRQDLITQIRTALRGLEGLSRIITEEEFKEFGVASPKDDPRAPDMILFAEEGCVFSDTADGDLPFIEKPERGGSHGHDSNLPNLHAVFVAWGAGIKPGVKLAEISNLDVAPTIANLLGFSLPQAEGKPLSAALAGN